VERAFLSKTVNRLPERSPIPDLGYSNKVRKGDAEKGEKGTEAFLRKGDGGIFPGKTPPSPFLRPLFSPFSLF